MIVSGSVKSKCVVLVKPQLEEAPWPLRIG
jgi:hypothetical protein